MITYRTNKYLIKPTATQKEMIKKTMECCTIVFNKFVKENGFETYKYKQAKEVLASYKSEIPILNEIDTSALFNLLFTLQSNRMNSQIVKIKNSSIKSYTTSNLNGRQAIYLINDEFINVPRLGNLKIVYHRKLPENVKIQKATISIDTTNSYYISISYYFESKNTLNNININNCIGLDYSQQHLFIDNNGKEVNMPHFYQQQEKRISKLKSAITKCRKGSNNYYKLKNKIGKIYKQITNQRNDYLHKLSTNIANKYDIVCVENLNMKEMASYYKLAKNTYDNSYSKFLEYLKYKMNDRGKMLIVIDKYFPSSKICNKCGYKNNDLTLNERIWKCPNCGEILNRDINAAINIRNEGIKQFTSIGYLDKTY